MLIKISSMTSINPRFVTGLRVEESYHTEAELDLIISMADGFKTRIPHMPESGVDIYKLEAEIDKAIAQLEGEAQ